MIFVDGHFCFSKSSGIIRLRVRTDLAHISGNLSYKISQIELNFEIKLKLLINMAQFYIILSRILPNAELQL